MHRVSLSRESFLASSRECQIRPHPGRDSKLVITPFMRVDNYSTRNFATLEPSELGLPFIGPSAFLLSQKSPISRHWAGVRLYTECFHVAKPCVFVKQFPISILCSLDSLNTIKETRVCFFRSYANILPSSFAGAMCLPEHILLCHLCWFCTAFFLFKKNRFFALWSTSTP